MTLHVAHQLAPYWEMINKHLGVSSCNQTFSFFWTARRVSHRTPPPSLGLRVHFIGGDTYSVRSNTMLGTPTSTVEITLKIPDQSAYLFDHRDDVVDGTFYGPVGIPKKAMQTPACITDVGSSVTESHLWKAWQ